MSDGSNELEARLDALETRLAYQDETIEALNRTVTQQWTVIEAIRRELADTVERLEDSAGDAPVERPPPHY